MEKYISQLIADLETAAQNPPAKPWIETPPHLKEYPEIAEIALVPYKSIEKWSGISMEMFPEMWQLSADQCRQVNRAIFKLFDSLNLRLVDLPGNMPPEILYEVLTTNWDQPMQYLPGSGMDLEFCTGDPSDCPYDDYCEACLEEEATKLSKKLRELVPKIAVSMDAGQVFFLNPETYETEEIAQSTLNNQVMENREETYAYEIWEQCWVFEPFKPSISLQIMENFAFQLYDPDLREKLLDALDKPSPLTHFMAALEGTDDLQDWFGYKQYQLEKQVKDSMLEELFQTNYGDTIIYNGIFDDDGNTIDPNTVPLPPLCTICKHHQTDDTEENMLCLLNRSDQRNKDEFECGSFEKI